MEQGQQGVTGNGGASRVRKGEGHGSECKSASFRGAYFFPGNIGCLATFKRMPVYGKNLLLFFHNVNAWYYDVWHCWL